MLALKMTEKEIERQRYQKLRVQYSRSKELERAPIFLLDHSICSHHIVQRINMSDQESDTASDV